MGGRGRRIKVLGQPCLGCKFKSSPGYRDPTSKTQDLNTTSPKKIVEQSINTRKDAESGGKYSQNDKEILPSMPTTIKTQDTAGGAAWGKTGTRPVSGNGKWCSCREKCGGSSKIKNRIDTGSSSSISVSTQKNSKHILKSSYLYTHAHGPMVYAATAGEAIQRAINKQRGKPNAGTHTYNGILFCLKKDKF